MQNANNFKRLILKHKNKPLKLLKYALYLEKWAKNFLNKTTAKGYCIGLSGGIDSSLSLAILCNIPDIEITGVFIDIESSKKSKEDAELLKSIYKFNYQYINLSKIYHDLVKQLNIENNQNAKINLKSRLRCIITYAIASKNNLLTCGTTNACERHIGYYTKFGDNACDINLIYWLLKSQIIYLAYKYKIPNEIIKKAPSADLYNGQTDEKEIGITYEEIDHYLSFAHINKIHDEKIKTKHLFNKHKLTAPARPKKFMFLRNEK